MDKTYKLTSGKYIHFRDREEGYDYTIYNNNGVEIDGGILEYDFASGEELTEDMLKKELADFIYLQDLLDPNTVEIDIATIEELQEKVFKEIKQIILKIKDDQKTQENLEMEDI